MFTGLVELTGVLRRRERRGPGYRVFVEGDLGPLELGESICVSGACLTVVAVDAAGFAADVSIETTERTTLGALALGSPVNLERSLRVGDRLGGHMLSGHVDGVAHFREAEALGDARRMRFGFPCTYAGLVAVKGSVALDGVSLTVNAAADDWLEVMVIPHTLARTNLGALRIGDALNFEVDLVARYVARCLEQMSHAAPASEGSLLDALERAGFVAPGGGAS
jgi:riboflavin synthase